jgi:hypothetical protein
MFALLHEANVEDRDQRLILLSRILARPVESTNELDTVEVNGVVDVLSHWKRQDELKTRCSAIIDFGGGQSSTEAQGLGATTEQTAGDGHSSRATQHVPAVPGPPLQDSRGHQIVQVTFGGGGNWFTYIWCGEGELKLGDMVKTPPPWWMPSTDPQAGDPGLAEVVALGSHYIGVMTALKERAENADV